MNLKKIIALALCVCMVLSFFPVSVFAEDWEDEVVLVDEEEYFEPQDEYVEEEIIIEEPVDYVEYVEPVEEIVVEDELPAEEPAEELIEEPVAPATPVEEAAAPAAMTAELETAETFGGALPVAYIGEYPYSSLLGADGAIAEAGTAAAGGGTVIRLVRDVAEDLPVINKTVSFTGEYTITTAAFTVADGTVAFENKAIVGDITVSGGAVTIEADVKGSINANGGTLKLDGSTVTGEDGMTVDGGDVTLVRVTMQEPSIAVNATSGKLAIESGSYSTVKGTIAGNITGGTYNRVYKVLLADGYDTINYAENDTYCSGTVGKTTQEAMVGTAATGRTYGSLTDLAAGTVVPTLVNNATYALTDPAKELRVKLNDNKITFTNTPAGKYAKVIDVTDGVTTYKLASCVATVEIAGAKYEAESLKEAVEMINNSTGLEGVITLCDNINMGNNQLSGYYDEANRNTEQLVLVRGAKVTVDGDDKYSISWGGINQDYALFPAMPDDVVLTIQNVVLTGLSDNTKVFTTYSNKYGQTATLNNCEFKNIFAAAYLNDAAGQTQTVNITNSTFDADCQGFLGCNGDSAKLNIAVTGNEFKAESLELCSLPEGSTFNISNNDFSAVESITVNYSNKVNVSGNYWGGSAPEVTVAAGWQGTGATLIVDTFQATEGAAETTTCEAYLETIVSGAYDRKYYATFAAAAGDANGNVIFLENNVAATYALSDNETLKVKLNNKTLNVTYKDVKVIGTVDPDIAGVTDYTASGIAAARIGDDYYPTLAAAITAAQTGETVTLLRDLELVGGDTNAASITIDKAITLDGNGYTITTDAAAGTAGKRAIAINVAKTGVTIKKLVVVSKNGQCISTNNGCDITLENVYLDHSNGTRGDVLMLNGNCDINGTFGFSANNNTWHGIVAQIAETTVDFRDCTGFYFTLATNSASEPSPGQAFFGTLPNTSFVGLDTLDAYYVEGTTSTPVSFVAVDGKAANVDTGFEPDISAKITSKFIAQVGTGANAVDYESFATAAAAAKQADTFVTLIGVEGTTYDAYALADGTLQVKLNSFVTDATVLATAPTGYRVVASDPDDAGVVTLSLAKQKYNLSKMVSGSPVVVEWYDTFDHALAAMTEGQFIVIFESYKHAFTAEDTVRVMYVKAEGENVAFTYTVPDYYEVKTRPDSSGSESTRYELTPITYTLTYDYDGATNTPTNPATYTVETDTFTLEAPEKTYYGFAGWFVDGATDAVASVTIPKGSHGDHSYKAKWVGNDLTVTIDGKGGVTKDSESVIVLPKHYGDAFVITDYADTFTRSHHHQTGWFNHTTGNTYIPSTVTYNFTVEATWAEDTYTVKFDKNDAAATGTMADESFTYSVAQALTENGFAKPGYTFQGWAESPSGQVVYTDGQSVSALVDENEGVKTLYAKWAPITYAVTFVDGAPAGTTATGEMADQQFTYDVAQKLTKNAFVIPGYTFTGWKSDMALSYTDEEEVSNLRSNIGNARVLTAQWEKDEYTITFATDGGTAINPMTYSVDSPDTIPAAIYPNDVMAFNGWKVTAVGTKGDWTVDQNVAAGISLTEHYGDVTLTAQWIDAEAHLKDKAGTDYYGTIDAMVTKYKANPTWWPDGQYVEIVRNNMVYPLTNGQTLSVNVNDKIFSTSPVSKAGTTQDTKFDDDFYATPGVLDPNGVTTTFGTAHYVAQVRTDNWTYTINPDGTESEPELKSSSYTLYETFATAADAALAVDTTHSGGRFQTATVMLLTANPVTYMLTKENLGDKELRIDLGAQTTANVGAQAGTRYNWTNPEDRLFIYTLVDTVTVSFDMNGKTGDAPASQTFDKGEKATRPTEDPTTTDGYTFTKWYAEAACTTEFDFGAAISTNTTVYAGWTPTEWGIKYTGGAYTNPNASITTYTVENRDSITFADAVSYGWHFDGWKLNGALLQNGKLPADKTGDIVLEATWSKKNYDVTFVTPADVPTPDAQRVPYNTKAMDPGDPDRDYYQFNGWYTSATPAAGDQKFDFENTLITEATTLYAIYTPTEYTITYYLNGGSLEEGVTNPTTYTVETETFTLKNPTKANWTFDGWTGSNSQDPGQSTVTITKGSHDNLEYGAHYKYTATFVMNGGTPEVPAQTNMERVLVTKPADDPTLADATFQGWYADAALTQEFDFNTAPNGNVTIYAKFVGEPRSIVFMDDYTHRIFQTYNLHVGDPLPEYAPTTLPERSGYALDRDDLWNPSIRDEQGNLKKVTTDQIFNLNWKQLFNVDFEVNDVVIESIGDIVSGSTIAKDDMPVVRKDGKVAKWVDKVTGEEFIFADGTVENPTQVTANLVLVASFDDTPATLADFTYNMSLTENLNMKFYVRNVKDDFHNYTVKVSIDGEDDQFFYLDNAEENIIPIAEFDATRMTDKIHVVVTDGDTEALNKVYTIAGYCNAVIESTGNEKLKELANAILVYGANAQLALDYKTGNLPTEDHDVSGVIIPAATAKTKGSVTGVSRFGNQVMVDSIVTLRVLLQVDSTASLDDYTVTVNDTEVVPVKQSATIWYVDIPVSALKLGERQIVYVEDDDGMATYALTTIVPMKRVNNDLARALYAYYDAATAYATSI